jgi:hypothetical protein
MHREDRDRLSRLAGKCQIVASGKDCVGGKRPGADLLDEFDYTAVVATRFVVDVIEIEAAEASLRWKMIWV